MQNVQWTFFFQTILIQLALERKKKKTRRASHINGSQKSKENREMSYLDQAGRAVLRVRPSTQQCLSSPSPTVMPAKSGGAITDSGPYPTESCCVFATAAAPWVFVLHSTERQPLFRIDTPKAHTVTSTSVSDRARRRIRERRPPTKCHDTHVRLSTCPQNRRPSSG